MKSNHTLQSLMRVFRFLAIVFVMALCLGSSCIYMKMNPPADVDKGPPPPPPPAYDNSCWMATASNMLAGAGYGTGSTVQDRAAEIYGEMVAQYGKANGGWTDAALQWWLSSTNNTWPNNPYTIVTVEGNKFPKYPWADPDGARLIANELRRCQLVGLSISWPTTGVSIGSGGHAITAWGDHSGDVSTLGHNPSRVRVTDSDRDDNGNVQNYRYDVYTNPNSGGPNEGNGWYINFDNNHPYIKHIITLCPTDDPSDIKLTQKVVGSYKIHQRARMNATDLHYQAGTDVNILSYRTKISWPTDHSPSIVEGDPRRKITVDWNLTDKPVPYCKWVIINTEFVLPMYNYMKYDDVYFTYPSIIDTIPALGWEVKTPLVENAVAIQNVTGGYVVGSFDIIAPALPPEQRTIAEYRFIHEYSYTQDPEDHVFILSGERGYSATDLRFGHSYGYLGTEQLWEFDDWMTEIRDTILPLDEHIALSITWEGRLPYPEGEDIKGRIPYIKEKE